MTSISTPLHIEILMHYYVAQTAFPRHHAPAVQLAISDLLDEKAIQWNAESDDKTAYRATEKGRAWVAALCAVPPPFPCWKDAATGKLLEVH